MVIIFKATVGFEIVSTSSEAKRERILHGFSSGCRGDRASNEKGFAWWIRCAG